MGRSLWGSPSSLFAAAPIMLLLTQLLFCTAFLMGVTQSTHTEPWSVSAVGFSHPEFSASLPSCLSERRWKAHPSPPYLCHAYGRHSGAGPPGGYRVRDRVHSWGTKNISSVCGEGCRVFIHLNLIVLVWEANIYRMGEHFPALHRGRGDINLDKWKWKKKKYDPHEGTGTSTKKTIRTTKLEALKGNFIPLSNVQEENSNWGKVQNLVTN